MCAGPRVVQSVRVEGRSLSELMAQSARDLQGETDLGSTMQLAVDLAVRDVGGAHAATFTIAHRQPRVEVGAATDDAARRSEELQHELGEGPCLEAIWEREVIISDLRREPRWPTWAARVAEETPFRSLLAAPAFVTADRVGTLNMYSREVGGFDAAGREYGVALASHVALAVRAAQQVEQLARALDSRTVIAQATGILMERSDLDPAQAFAVLARVASTLERKLRDVAEELVVTRRLPGTPGGVGRTARSEWPPAAPPEDTDA